MSNENALDTIRRRWSAWVAAGRSRDGFSRVVSRGFDDVVGGCGAKCWERVDVKPGDVLFIDRDFSIQWYRDSLPDFERLVKAVEGLGALAADGPLHSADGDETWTYTLLLVAEKSLAWIAQSQPARAELLAALAKVKGLLHKADEAAQLHVEARKAWDKGAKATRLRSSSFGGAARKGTGKMAM